MNKKILLLVAFVLLFSSNKVVSLDNGLGRTPEMGWNSWNCFGCFQLNEQAIKDTADKIVELGLDKKGYQYVGLDDCWSIGRNVKTGEIMPDPKRFPSGIKALADYVHSKGLKIGIYSDAGYFTCQFRPGSLFHEDIDAQTFASWGIDLLKYDNCFNGNYEPQFRYPRMKEALNKTNRPIYFEMCEWGVDNPWEWASPLANSWRSTIDIQNTWDSIVYNLEQEVGLAKFAGPTKGWNNPDLLEIGNPGISQTEAVSQFALWALLKAPLILSFDFRTASQEILDLVGNEEIIAINQDELGQQGDRIYSENNLEIWSGPQANGDTVVVLLNKNEISSNITVNFSQLGINSANIFARDLVQKKNLGQFDQQFTGLVEGHGVIMLRLSQQQIVSNQ